MNNAETEKELMATLSSIKNLLQDIKCNQEQILKSKNNAIGSTSLSRQCPLANMKGNFTITPSQAHTQMQLPDSR